MQSWRERLLLVWGAGGEWPFLFNLDKCEEACNNTVARQSHLLFFH